MKTTIDCCWKRRGVERLRKGKLRPDDPLSPLFTKAWMSPSQFFLYLFPKVVSSSFKNAAPTFPSPVLSSTLKAFFMTSAGSVWAMRAPNMDRKEVKLRLVEQLSPSISSTSGRVGFWPKDVRVFIRSSVGTR